MYYRPTPVAAALAFAFLAPLTYSLPAGAQQTDTAKPDQALPSITVNASADASASGLPEAYPGGQVARGGRVGFLGNKDFLETPFNSIAYTGQLIKDQQAKGVGDVLLNDPTIRVTRGYGNYQESYMIRGFITNSDDLAYNGLYGLLPRQYVAAEMLERVEVFRGASAFLNGATPGGNAIGGTINLLPKRASSEPTTQVTAGVESGGQTYVAADIGRRFGPDDRLGLRLNAVRRAGGTAIDNENRELNMATIGVDYRGNSFRLSADLGLQEYNLTSTRPSVRIATAPAGYVPSVPSASSNYGQKWFYSNERDLFGTVRGEWDLAQDVTSWFALGMRQGTENNSLATPNVNATNGNFTSNRFDNSREDYVWTGEVGIRGKFATGGVKHSVSASASSYWQDSRNAYAMSTNVATTGNLYSPSSSAQPALNFFGGSLASPETTTKTQLSSIALADTLSVLDERLQLTLGGRYQRLKTIGYDYNTHLQNNYYNNGTVTPVAGIVFKLTKEVSLYSNYIEGLQPGTKVSDTTATNFGALLAPYKSKQKEVGVKYDAGKIGLTVALFNIEKPNVITVGPTANPTYTTSGKQENQGVEIGAFGEPVRGLHLLAGLTLLDAKQKRTQNGAYDGKDAIGSAKTMANVGADWDVPGVQGLAVSGRVIYTSKQYVDSANAQGIPAWTRLDVGARYVTDIGGKAVTLRGGIQNLANRNYWESAGGSSALGYLVQNAPRTFITSASIDF
ncbi:TonB-dependent siderophore receptor [Herbaspirillum lusitanum]|uniref:TonB-dependent receptor n=1 Tax=Herbaspirillum lusitanum TaxID=213312 RepID=UPI0022376549|nr:TonB-dependent siderophore receptor [Herbaspirillum lusitanum]MCW5298717.1 TonB-dependent siderophore receptor [Herbaspirillum lusitanum]